MFQSIGKAGGRDKAAGWAGAYAHALGGQGGGCGSAEALGRYPVLGVRQVSYVVPRERRDRSGVESFTRRTYQRSPLQHYSSSTSSRSARPGRCISDLYDLYDLYDLAHVAGWEPYITICISITGLDPYYTDSAPKLITAG